MSTTTFRFIDRDYQDVTDTDVVHGYVFQDYFDANLGEITNSRAPGEIRSLLAASYKGPDVDGIGVLWTIS